MVHTFTIRLPRHAFTTRQVARAGDVWRAFQECAVTGSAAVGWPPDRYREEGIAFIVRSMTVVHHRESVYGEPVDASTWVSSFRRGLISHREIRLAGTDGPIASTTQEWVHVRGMKPARAREDLLADFAVTEHEPSVAMPEFKPVEGPVHDWRFTAWHTWMDPLGHANHPLYIDWSDEALARLVADRGIDPVRVVPVAEHVRYKAGVLPGEVTVQTRCVGVAGDAIVCEHVFTNGDGKLAATATTVRACVDADLREVLC